MKDSDKASPQSDVWAMIFNGLVEAIKMIFSVILAIAAAGSKTSHPATPSME